MWSHKEKAQLYVVAETISFTQSIIIYEDRKMELSINPTMQEAHYVVFPIVQCTFAFVCIRN